MERKIEIEVSLKGLDIEETAKFCQGDKNTQFMDINFLEDIELENYTLQVLYLPPYPATIPYFDTFSELKKQMTIPIPNRVLERNGKVKVELTLSKQPNVITINKSFEFEVIKTMNSTCLTAYPEGDIKETIAQQIEKVQKIVEQAQDKIDEYNQNTLGKVEEFNNNSSEKLNSFNTNFNEKLKEYNDNTGVKTNEFNTLVNTSTENFNTNADEKLNSFNENYTKKTDEFNKNATAIFNNASQNLDEKVLQALNQASELMIAQQNKSVKEINDAGVTEVRKVTNAGTEEISKITNEGITQQNLVTSEGNKQVDLVKKQGENDILKIQNATTDEIKKVTDEGTKQVNAITAQGNTSKKFVEDKGLEVSNEALSAITNAKETAINEAKGNINVYVEETSKSNIDLHVNNTSKPEIDNYVETVSKESINNYITSKESEIKGATYTPTIDEAGNLSFTNDKSLPNPPTVNIKGPKGEDGINGNDGTPGAKGEKGDTPVKGVDYYTEAEKQEFAQSINSSITAEGNKQVKAVQNQGTTSLQAVTKVQSDIEALLRDQAVEGNALSLNGKTGPQYDKEIQGVAGGYSGNFPLTSAVLDGIYLVPQTGKFYVCTKAYSGSNLTAPNANFEELSVWKNRERLSNLTEVFDSEGHLTYPDGTKEWIE